MEEVFYSSKLSRYVICLILPFVFLVQAAKMFGLQLNTILHAPLLLLIVYLGYKKIGWLKKTGSGKNITLFTVYLAYVFGSVVMYVVNGLPLDVYTSSFTTYIFPMFFFLWGADTRDTSDNFCKVLFFSMLAAVSIGLYLHFTMPSFYTSYMYEVKQSGYMASQYVTEDTIMESKRFSGIFASSYTISYLGMCSLIIALSWILTKRTKYSNVMLLVTVSIFLISLFLCLQRIAMAMTMFFLLLFFLWGNKYGVKSLRYYGMVILALLIIIPGVSVTLSDRGDQLLTLLTARFEVMDFGEAMAGRTNQYAHVDFFSIDKIFGLGIGSASTYAIDNYHVKGVTDGEYPKQIMELGYVGVGLLFTLIIRSILNVRGYFRYFSMELCIVLYYLVAGIGHDSLTTYYTVYAFWFFLGRLNNSAYRERVKLLKYKEYA